MSPHKLLRYLMLGAVALVVLAAEPTAPPQPPPPEVKICVLAILATDKNDTIDKRVECIAREVQKVDPKLTGFQVHKMMSKSVALGGKVDFNVIDDEIVGVAVDHGLDKDSRVQVKVEPPTLGEITYETCCGKFLPLITRYQTKDKQLLIIAVRVQTCQGK
jgi:hypothetical protein